MAGTEGTPMGIAERLKYGTVRERHTLQGAAILEFAAGQKDSVVSVAVHYQKPSFLQDPHKPFVVDITPRTRKEFGALDSHVIRLRTKLADKEFHDPEVDALRARIEQLSAIQAAAEAEKAAPAPQPRRGRAQ